ncbi:MAG: hypothetical protein AAF399_21830 [Bacteroidota bacterium]
MFLRSCFWLCLLCPLGILAQNLQADAAFFHAQTKSFDRWLGREGLGDYLSVYALDVQEDKLLLYLQFTHEESENDSTRLDQAVASWKLVKTYYDSLHSRRLEEAMLHQLSFLMEVNQREVQVLLYDTHDKEKHAVFMRFLYFWQGKVKVRERGQMKSETVRIRLKAPAGQGRAEERLSLEGGYQQTSVFQAITAYCQQRFTNVRCEGREAHLEPIQEEEVLHFQVWNLCREVLYYMDKSELNQFLSWLGVEADWAKREMLDVQITYSQQPDGIELVLILNGKIGSGLFEEDRRGGYYNMEDDFDDAFAKYAQRFKTDLTTYLREHLK